MAAAAFAMKPAEVTRAIEACLEAAVSDPPSRSGRAGFARQRWRNSQMTGTTVRGGLKGACTCYSADRRAASVTISKADEEPSAASEEAGLSPG